MAAAVRELYGRVLPFARAMPVIVALPFVAELVQHVVEIRIGMYAPGGAVTGDEQGLRLAFGAVKVLAIFLAFLFALRWWGFAGDSRRALRPTRAMLKGLAILLLVQGGGELLIIALSASLAELAGGSAGVRLAVAAGPLLAWLLLITYLLPWFAGLLIEDKAMTPRRSIAGISGRLWANFGLLLAGYLPAMAVHYALGYAAMGRSEAAVWALMLVDAAVVALLAVSLASAYFTIYRRAAERTSGGSGPAPFRETSRGSRG
ncbi:MAG TPA: hypothetical protein VGW34_13310 [Allosphingosinicella sp.]|nr:hypothetical protein [Allosphingosinicella sp.]